MKAADKLRELTHGDKLYIYSVGNTHSAEVSSKYYKAVFFSGGSEPQITTDRLRPSDLAALMEHIEAAVEFANE